MMMFLGFFLLSVIGTSWAVPVDAWREDDPELTAGFFEGDIVLDGSALNGIRKSSKRWPNGIIYYKIMKGFFDAMKSIEDVSCVRFKVANSNQPYFINITGNSRGCFSGVGFSSNVQKLNLQPHPLGEGCFRVGSPKHEPLHALGFYHLQSTYNCDEYVRIVEENIENGEHHNFKKFSKETIDDFGAKYDYGSIMYYPRWAYSKNGNDTTYIISLRKVKNGVMGQHKELSKDDIYKLNKMYKCEKKL